MLWRRHPPALVSSWVAREGHVPFHHREQTAEAMGTQPLPGRPKLDREPACSAGPCEGCPVLAGVGGGCFAPA